MQSPAEASGLSLFTPMGYQRSKCGYCKKGSGSASYYAQSANLRDDHYQELMDRGWRRLDAASFKPRKDQRKALNRWNKYVLGPEYSQKVTRLCPKSREEKRRRRNNFDLLSAVHESEYKNLKRPKDPATGKSIEPAHKFEVTLESDSYSKSKYDVFLPYQVTVHREPKSRWSTSSFTRFLCSGIERKTLREAGTEPQKTGSYHQCYRLDGRLVAVGVIDLLPHGVSAVYLFYDPDMGEWEFGKLSALREIALALEGPYKYYYMGFYIHSCIKMRYKANYEPQYVLDPESFAWDPLDDNLRKKLDDHPYVSLSRERASTGHDGSIRNEEDSREKKAEQDNTSKAPSATQPATLDKTTDVSAEGSGSEEEGEVPEGSLFDLAVPGILTMEEVETLVDLDHWALMANGTLVEMEDLVAWEDSNIREPQSIKGIVAELAAALGPKVVKESAVKLF